MQKLFLSYFILSCALRVRVRNSRHRGTHIMLKEKLTREKERMREREREREREKEREREREREGEKVG